MNYPFIHKYTKDMLTNMNKEQLIDIIIQLSTEDSDNTHNNYKSLIKDLEWPRNLIAIISRDKKFAEMFKPPIDWAISIDYVLSTLSNKNEHILREYVQHGKTLQEISKELNYSREYIRQCIHNTINTLSCGERRDIILYGIKTTLSNQIYISKDMLKHERQLAYNKGYEDGLVNQSSNNKTNKIDLCANYESIFIRINDLSLSVRTNRALNAINAVVLGQIACMNSNKLEHIRNIGTKSLIEIKQLITHYKLDKISPDIIRSELLKNGYALL